MFASEIYDQNTIAEAEGRPTLNLKSVLIGNGITDISTCVYIRIGVSGQPFISMVVTVSILVVLPLNVDPHLLTNRSNPYQHAFK